MGPNYFSVKATEQRISFGTVDIRGNGPVNQLYYVKTYKIELLSPAQNAYLDFDKGDGDSAIYVKLKVQSSNSIKSYIRNINTGQYKNLPRDSQNPSLNFDDTNIHTVYIPIKLDDLISYAGALIPYICYQTFTAKFINYYTYNSIQYTYELLYHFKVIWNRAHIEIYLNALYTGRGNDGKIEYKISFEQMAKGQFTESSIKKFDPYTKYYCGGPNYWPLGEYNKTYDNGADGAVGWWRKDTTGKVYSVEEQRRCFKTYDCDFILPWIYGEELRFTLYFWLDPHSNPSNLLISGYSFKWDTNGHFSSFYWEIDRHRDFGDYFFDVTVIIHVFPIRTTN